MSDTDDVARQRADLLQEEIDRRFGAGQLQLDQRIEGQRELMAAHIQRLDQRMADADKAIQAALVSAEKAVTKAETASEKRFEGINEFRAVLSDQQRTLLPRVEFDVGQAALTERINSLAERFTALELRLTSQQEHASGSDAGTTEAVAAASRLTNTRIAALTVLISVVVIVVNLAIYFTTH